MQLGVKRKKVSGNHRNGIKTPFAIEISLIDRHTPGMCILQWHARSMLYIQYHKLLAHVIEVYA